jgi:hypothetical protein
LGGGNRAKIGAKIDKITEKRHFLMDFFRETFSYSISPIYQQIAIIINEYIEKKLAKKLNSPPNQGLLSSAQYEQRCCDHSSPPNPHPRRS